MITAYELGKQAAEQDMVYKRWPITRTYTGVSPEKADQANNAFRVINPQLPLALGGIAAWTANALHVRRYGELSGPATAAQVLLAVAHSHLADKRVKRELSDAGVKYTSGIFNQQFGPADADK